MSLETLLEEDPSEKEGCDCLPSLFIFQLREAVKATTAV